MLSVTLLTGGSPHYEAGLISGLAQQEVDVDVIGGDELMNASALKKGNVHFFNYQEDHAKTKPTLQRLLWIGKYYFQLWRHLYRSSGRIVHIQWPYKAVFFDRTFFVLYLKALRKKVIFTVHNVDQAARDGKQTLRNSISLRFLYQHAHGLITHTEKMKAELRSRFAVPEGKIAVLPHGLMSEVPESSVTPACCRDSLGLRREDRVLLFFGLISPYKGLETLVQAFASVRAKDSRAVLVIAGRVKECSDYWSSIEKQIDDLGIRSAIRFFLHHIPDEQVERFYKAADVCVMPYRQIFQSGVIFLAYRFGLPVVATDVGSLSEDIIPGKTGLLCRPDDPGDLALQLQTYFASEMYEKLPATRRSITAFAESKYGWSQIAARTVEFYKTMAP